MPAKSLTRAETKNKQIINDNNRTKERITSKMTNDNHSNLEEIQEMTDLDRLFDRLRCPHAVELHNEGDVYGKETIMKKGLADVYGGARKAVDLKFKLHKWTGAYGRTMGLSVRATACLVLLLTLLVTCTAAPERSRPARSIHGKEAVRSYLETFGYLKKGQPEVGNLLMGDVAQSYEDDFRIAIKTLQEFGGIPITGEVDSATKNLLKQRRCGRPDREPGNEGRRTKRFAVQGEKWKHTNLTWSMSSSRIPSQLDLHGTRSVLARALDVWEQASRLTFTEINSDEADIVVSFAKRYHDDAYPFDGRGIILAHAFFPGSGRGGDAHFDDDELWLLQPKNDDEEGTSLFAVAAHEFGHSLGLSHSSVKGALMYPWYQGIQPNFVLPEDDRNGIQQMYGPKVKRTWARIPNYRPAETPPPTTTSTTTTTTTRRPYIHHHHNRHPNHRPDYTPYPRTPYKYPAYYPDRRTYPERPNYPTYYPERRHHNSTDDYPKRTHNHYPRPTPETTTQAVTYRPHYPTTRSEYPSYPRPNHPQNPTRNIPKTKPYYPERTTVRPTPPSDKPDTCDTSYDAVALIRGELFIFKNRYHWRIGSQGRYPQYPIEILRMWSGLPQNLTHVDAVYERRDKKIAFFVGRELYLFDSQYLMPGYPKPLTDVGLPPNLQKIDAAMVWGYNDNTYFYSGTSYWKFDEHVGRVEPDYPRDMIMWEGIGYNIDSAFQWKDGKTYFFKGKGFWKFNDISMRVEHDRQLPSATFWMGCPAERSGRRAPFRALPAPGSTLRSPGAAHTHAPSYLVTLISSAILILYSYIIYCP